MYKVFELNIDMESSYNMVVIKNKGESTYKSNAKRSNLSSSISLRGSSFEDVFVDYPASQKVPNGRHYTDDETIDMPELRAISLMSKNGLSLKWGAAAS
ncbi:hypothetical protein TorRG33x02_085850 [Trema orientale]|uniref:Uncharacterized protein n=1 Tax=Trema orientale TaxID=63057 RepID=A0A2P5FDC9_TREOI|nr:hypothetical protein TorRG33x02_085850 [Trema orientale]